MRSTPRSVPALGMTFALLAGASVLGLASPASAAELIVTTTADGGAGSLRDAIATASANGEANIIVLAQGATYELDDCVAGDLDYTGTEPLEIFGVGATIVQTCPDERVINASGPLTVTDTTITGGEATGGIGGGIAAVTSTVNLVRSTVAGNQASFGGGVAAIHVTLEQSTVSGNSATSTGGGIWADQTVTATNSTITGNDAGSGGGGIVVVNTSATLVYVTLVGNDAPTGANLALQPGSDDLVSFASVIAQGGGGGDDCELAVGVTVASDGSNATDGPSCALDGGPGDRTDVADPGLGALGDNGGPTPTRPPAAGSPLIDGAVCADSPVVVVSDQRGVTRPQGGACDVGAVEVAQGAPPPGPPTTVPAAAVTPTFTG